MSDPRNARRDRGLERLLRESLPPALRTLLEVFGGFFTRQTLRHALPPLLGAALALYFGAAYLKDLLELPNLRLAGPPRRVTGPPAETRLEKGTGPRRGSITLPRGDPRAWHHRDHVRVGG